MATQLPYVYLKLSGRESEPISFFPEDSIDSLVLTRHKAVLRSLKTSCER